MDLRDLIAAAPQNRGRGDVRETPFTRPPANPELDLFALMFGIERLDTVLGC
jgi:hypothetical protein